MGKWFAFERGIRNLYQVQEVGGVMGWWIVGAFAWVLVVIGICLFVSINKSEDDERFYEP